MPGLSGSMVSFMPVFLKINSFYYSSEITSWANKKYTHLPANGVNIFAQQAIKDPIY